MVECYPSISIWVVCRVENHVKKIIRLTIWPSKDGVICIPAYALIWKGLGKFGDTVPKASQIADSVSLRQSLKKIFSVLSTSTMTSAEETSSMFDYNKSHKPVPKGLNFIMLAKPELRHMVYEASWYQAPWNKRCTISICSVWWNFWKILKWGTESTP